MPNWYFDKKELLNTPSAADGIDTETELRYRKDGARFIQDTGTKMDLGCNTMATGVVYFHRFYMYHSFRQFPRYVTASCCLLLAGKVEETPKKCKDIIWAAKSYLSEQKFATFGDDPKEEVMTMERILLQTIKFDLLVEHPYHYLLKYAKCLKGDKQKLQKMVQMAWTFVNDSLCTTLCLQWEPEVIAVALMYLAGKLSKFEALDWTGRQPKHLRWWDMFIDDITMDLLEDICHQVLDLYSQPPTTDAPDSPPPSRHGPSQSLTPNQNRDGVKDSHSPKIAAPPVAVGAPIPNIVPRSGPKHPPPIVPTAIPPGSIIGANGDLTKITIDPTKPPPSLGVPIVDVLPPPGGPPPPGPFVQPPMGPPPQFIPTPVVPGAPPRIPPHPVVSHPPGPPPPVNIYTPPFPPPPNHVYHGPPPGAGYHGGPPYYPP